MANFDLKVLCVDDEEAILESYQRAVQAAGFTAVLCSNPKDAVKQFQDSIADIALVIADFRMPEMTGFELRQAILPEGTAVPFIVVSSYVTKEMALQALDLKIDAFFDKPIGHDGIIAIIEKYAKARVEIIRESRALEAVFIEEATGILEEMDTVLLSLDHDRGNADKLNLIFRAAHTIKGSSGILGSDVVTRYVHKYEDIISAVKKGQIELSDSVYEVLLKGFDRIRGMIAAVETKTLSGYRLDEMLPELEIGATQKPSAGAPKSQAAAPTAGQSLQKAKDSIAVPIEMLEQLSTCSGEITVIRNMVNKLVKGLERQYVGNRDIQNLGELLDEMHKINGTIQTHITDLRKVPLSGVLKPIPRIIRDLAKDLGKSIVLKIEGDKLRVDNALATVCSNSLVHLVRNSADHGIEDVATRKALGKPEAGTVVIRCRESGEEVHITITDDGRGIDPGKIRAKALEKGLFTTAQLNEMNEQQTLSIIFASGFSTASKVTDVSGRGVGMDMVRSSVEAVGGQILIESTPGAGSTFHLRLPIPKSVLIITSLLVDAGDRSFAVPQDSIQRVLRIEAEKFRSMVQMASLGRTLRHGDEIFPLLALGEVLGFESRGSGSRDDGSRVAEVLILETDGLRYALLVDGIQDAEEIVVKRLQSYFNPKGAFAGATFMGDGSVGLILDVKGIAELGGLRSVEAKSAAETRVEASVPQAGTAEGSGPEQNFLLFKLGSKAVFGVPLEQVFRLEEFDAAHLQRSGAERVIVYRDGVMPIYSLQKLLGLQAAGERPMPLPSGPASSGRIPTIVAKRKDGYCGLQVETVVDIAAAIGDVSPAIRDRPGVVGNAQIRDHNVTIVDLPTVLGRPKGKDSREHETKTKGRVSNG